MKKNKIILFTLLLIGLFGCHTEEPAKFTTWRCVETSIQGQRTYLIDIYRSLKDTTIYTLSNFQNISHEGDYDIRVKIINNSLMFFPTPQQIGNSQYKINSGSGIVRNNFTEIQMNYTVYDYDEKSDIAYQAILTRQ